jgi:hypothetical protein
MIPHALNRPRVTLTCLICCWVAANDAVNTLSAIELKVYPEGKRPSDSRLEPLKDLDGYFPFEPSATPDQWQQRAQQRQTAIKVALGLWPMPTATPLNAVIHGKQEFDGYQIEKVYFESMPGFFVTGNLYRPSGEVSQGAKRPAVLSPHGHFQDGRFGDQGVAQVRREIVMGAERFEEGGRNQLQSRAVQLARMGCVVFLYDMIGYCDSTQISYDLAHRFVTQRPEMIDRERWGLFSPQAESMLQGVMGLQAYNAVRAIDFLISLPDVDPDRIAVTGASGGGTQTFIVGAIDPRPAVLVPAVMVSTAMQGGCTCENASLLRIGTGNVEFAALIAPRPLCLISANDWTREMPEKGYPQLRQHYQMLGATDQLEHHPLLHFGHNYNYVSRSAMYQFLNRHLQLGLESPVVEQDYERLGREQLTVWDDQHPQPEGGPEFERQLLQHWTRDTQTQLAAHRPLTADSYGAYEQIVRPGWQAILRRGLPDATAVDFREHSKQDTRVGLVITGSVVHHPATEDPGRPGQQEEIPVAALIPNGWQGGPVAIWLSTRGKAGLLVDGDVDPHVQRLLDRQIAVLGVDLMEQGELSSSDEQLTQTRRVENPRESAAYTYGYNDPLFVQRVHDVLTILGAANTQTPSPSEVWLVGLDGAGPWAAAALAQVSGKVDRAVVDTEGFRFLHVDDIRDPQFLPGGAKYGDLPGLLTLAHATKLWLAGEPDDAWQTVREAFEANGAAVNGAASSLVRGETADAAIAWLLSP